MVHRPGDMAGGVLWLGAGLFTLFLLARDLLGGVGWVYYSSMLLFPGVAMLGVGQWLVRRSSRPKA